MLKSSLKRMKKKNNPYPWPRKIIHLDMDAFFAAVEQRDRPEWRGKPVIVGGDPYGRGVVATASYEARSYGIRSAMPAAHARRLCPSAVFVRPDFNRYKQASEAVMAILRQHSDLVEPVSLDEAYLDVTQHKLGMEDPTIVASLIKQNIKAVTQLSSSAGVAPNLFLAKIASDFNKPDGLTVISPEDVGRFLEDLPVRKIPGVGPVTEAHLKKLNIHTCGVLGRKDLNDLCREFGKTGVFLYERARGIDEREVEPDVPSKQISTEETYAADIKDIDWLQSKLRDYAEEIFSELEAEGRSGKTITLKIKYFDFELITRSRTLREFPQKSYEVFLIACDLLRTKTQAGKKPIRLMGLGISGLEDLQDIQKRLAQKDLFA